MPTKVVRSAAVSTLGPRGHAPATLVSWARLRAYHTNAGPPVSRSLAMQLTGSPGENPRSVIDEALYPSTYIPPG